MVVINCRVVSPSNNDGVIPLTVPAIMYAVDDLFSRVVIDCYLVRSYNDDNIISSVP